MPLRNTTTAWGTVAKALHWVVALLGLFLVAYGWWMIHVAERSARPGNFAFHTALGYSLLLVVLLRLCWRAFDPAPAPPANSAPWERIGAHIAHALLYLLLIGASITGWLIVGSSRRPIEVQLLGFIPVPLLNNAGNRALHDLAEDIHRGLSYAMLALVVVHVAAALRHHFVKKNDVLRRMW